MAETLDRLRRNIRELQEQLEEEYRKRRDAIDYYFRGRKVVFGAETLQLHRDRREALWRYLRHAKPLAVLTAPVIYSLIIPFALMHFWVWIYQMICFPVYGIAKVPMRDFIRVDRHMLSYLNVIEKFNCIYCGYCNGVVAWVREVAARTEAHWCPIKHASRVEGTHEHYAGFEDYGDADGYVERLVNTRRRKPKG